MEVHRPKAARSLREFFVELLTIVAGIVIAISLEQLVETLHWHRQVHTAREALHQELLEADGFYAFRLATNECVARRLSQLNDIVESAAAHAKVDPVGDVSLHIGHLLTDDAWQSERAAQTLVHFPAAERERYSTLYAQQLDIRNWINGEIGAWASIRLLQGNPERLAASDITAIRQNIQMARVLNYLIVINAAQQLSRTSELGLPKAEADAKEAREACLPLERSAPTRPFTSY